MTNLREALTPTMCEALEAVVEQYSDKHAASVLGVSAKAVTNTICRAKKRLGATTRLHALLMWDRWARQEGQ